ncbi:MAG: MBL fold metallo-hydrolase [Clostridiaceae bacterium]|nr:MBL fold metallo-hydrolase [Clostridiaceae bacterium]
MSIRARACTLVSGSSGNSIFIENADTRILVDAGVSAKMLEMAMNGQGIDPATLSGILVTHEHSDHISGLSVLARRYKLPVFTTQKTFAAAKGRLGFAEKIDVRFIAPDVSFEIGSMAFRPFRTPHDAAESMGFRIDTGYGVISVASDIGTWTETIAESVSGSNLVFIEANYDPDMLWFGPYPWPLKKRIDSEHGHLSNGDCGTAIGRLIHEGSTRFVLIHLSKENNRPDLAYNNIEALLAAEGARSGSDYTMLTAPRYTPSCWQLL